MTAVGPTDELRRQWRARHEPPEDPPAGDLPPPRPGSYNAIPDPHFRGVWRVEPQPYRGRGFVYIFRGHRARIRAIGWAKHKNRELGKS